MTVAVTVLASIAAFAAFQHELGKQRIAFLADYVSERSYKEGQHFIDLSLIHASLDRALKQRMAAMDQATADKLFDDYFPLHADGTRRTAPALLAGDAVDNPSRIYGVGGFIAEGRTVSPLDRKLMVAATHVVARAGETLRGKYGNVYFYSPKTMMVMFGPDSPERLDYYRKNAPASLRIANTEMVRMTTTKENSSRQTRCTHLQAYLSDNDQSRRIGTGCATPVDLNGAQLGAFGSSITVTGYLAGVVKRTVPGASNLVIDGEGTLIAYPGFSRPGVASGQTVRAIEQDMRLTSLVKDIRASGKDSGVLKTHDGRKLVAYGRLRGPNWYLLMSIPSAAITWSALKSASWILLVGIFAAALQAALVVSLAKRTIVRPLRRLASASTYSVSRRGMDMLADIERQDDEIGALARALRRERNKVEELLDSLECRVKTRTAELENANLEKSRFLANMSHELRTPLNGVVAVSEMLAKTQRTKRDRELAELVVSSGRLLESVLTDILDFSKIEAGQLRLEAAEFDLEKALTRIAALHEIVAQQKGVELKVTVDPAVRGVYRGDSVRFTQVISNLLSNGIKFTDEGEVEVSLSQNDAGVVVKVRDTGVGFSKEVRAKLFRRFQQADASVTRKYGGTGLGLAISSSLAEMMGGKITAESEVGVGSTFTFTVPLQRVQAQPDTVDREADAEDGPGLAGARVLLAEDHPTNQRVVRLILDAVGVDLTVVDNGALAVEAAAVEAFDLILMDMQMPVMDGLTATRKIREAEAAAGRPAIPVIMLTANALDEHVAASRAAGADRHVAKPLRPEALLHEMFELISAARDERTEEAA